VRHHSPTTSGRTPRQLAALAAIVPILVLAIGASPVMAATMAKYPSGNSPVGVSAWAGTGNVGADDGNYAFITVAHDQTVAIDWSSFGFDSIPAGSAINSVDLDFKYHLFDGTGADSVTAEPYVSGSPAGSAASDSGNPTSDVVVSQPVTGLSRADLLDGTFKVRFSYSRGASGALNNTVYIDYIRVTVDYTPPNSAPVWDAIPDQTVAEAATKNLTISATDADGDLLILVKTGGPAWATVTDNFDGTASVHLAPDYGDATGSPYTVNVAVTDAAAPPVVASFQVTVTHTNRPPVLDPISAQNVAEGSTLDVPLSATDPDGDALVLAPGAAFPAVLHATLTDNGDGTGTVSFAPDLTAAAGSPYTIAVDVTDGQSAPVQQTFQLTVTNLHQRPVLDAVLDQTVAEGATLHIDLHATDADGDPITLSASAFDPSLHAVFTDNGDGTGSIDFAPDYAASTGSPYTIHVYADDTFSASADEIIFHLTVTDASPSDPVVTVPADMTVAATSSTGASVSFSVTATDAEDGSLTPTCDHASGETFPIGTTTVTCSATDADSNVGSATFHVTVVDTAPAITAPGGARCRT